jgi:hypothetical protein
MQTFETQLQEWAIAAGQHPAGSLARRQLLTRIVSAAGQSGKLWRAAGADRDDYDEALQKTWLYVCHRIEAYDPDRAGVMTWINHYLQWRIKDIQIARAKEYGLRLPIGPEPDAIDHMMAQWVKTPPPAPSTLLSEIHHWLTQEEPRLQSIHIQQRPDLHCQLLIRQRLLLEQPWKDLSQSHRISLSTLSNFFQLKCLPPLRQFVQSQGYAD